MSEVKDQTTREVPIKSFIVHVCTQKSTQLMASTIFLLDKDEWTLRRFGLNPFVTI